MDVGTCQGRGDSVMPELLFAYGTLGPDRRGSASGGRWEADMLRGRLYDLGPYPALVDADDPEAGWVHGHVRAVEPAEFPGGLDAYEGVARGLYRRSRATTRGGRLVWVYLYARPLPSNAHGPIDRWDGPRSR